MPLSSKVSVILLDIEGTTTPIDFVYETLFPFAREQMEAFLNANFDSPTLSETLTLIQKDHAAERDPQVPAWENSSSGISRYLIWLMDQDRKATGLKAVQGLIWKAGYASGELKATLYDDVAPAIQRWTDSGLRVCIYSSGSI
ncbi:MAG: acireductone synthase, partial [Cyanothece sp. SIO1E1]|nr:acireductone synthase [Cyanothece sp. SIO1E1]